MVIPEDEKSQEQKLEEEIAALKTRIKNTEYDLEHMFKGNDIIQQKLDNTKKLKDEKHKLLMELTGGKDKTEEIKEMEEKLTEKDTTQISKEQEDLLEKEIEKEFM